MERLKLRGILPWSFLLILLALKIQTSRTTDNPAATATATPTSSTTADLWRVKDGSIYDGDTLRMVRGSEELKIRFCGIDAPEKDQALGVEARDHLRSLVAQGDGSVMVVPIEEDRYGRTVAELFIPLADGSEIFLNGQMVTDGYAYHYEQYSDSCPNQFVLVEGEAIAQSSRVGVWARNYQLPWEYRKSQ
ncbi:MAG: thermonuclease family protein [Cyanobacteria bacterium P01_A01_bin.37]